jgi:uncharacterized membrane protein
MTTRKIASETSVDAASAKVAGTKKPRKWVEVVKEIQALREAGANVPEICEKLEVSYVLVNQVMLQSYKMAIDSEQVFERQEKLRLGIE